MVTRSSYCLPGKCTRLGSRQFTQTSDLVSGDCVIISRNNESTINFGSQTVKYQGQEIPKDKRSFEITESRNGAHYFLVVIIVILRQPSLNIY